MQRPRLDRVCAGSLGHVVEKQGWAPATRIVDVLSVLFFRGRPHHGDVQMFNKGAAIILLNLKLCTGSFRVSASPNVNQPFKNNLPICELLSGSFADRIEKEQRLSLFQEPK